MLWFKKKVRASDRIEEYLQRCADELEEEELGSERATSIISSVKIMTEAKANLDKADQYKLTMAKDILCAVASSTVEGGLKMAGDVIKSKTDIETQQMRIEAREDELAICLAQENGLYELSTEKINSSPTWKKYQNQTIKL